MVGELCVMTPKDGDIKMMWDKTKAEEIVAADDMFNTMKGRGYIAYSVVGKNGEKGEVIKDFDPDAERIIMTPPMQGG